METDAILRYSSKNEAALSSAIAFGGHMAAVFDGAVKVARAVKDPKTDKNLPSSGSLSWGGIKGAAGLAGTTGADCRLVHGDSCEQVDGNHAQTVNQNVTQTVGINQTVKVGADHKQTICGTANETIIGPHIISNLNVYNETRLGPHIQVHGDNEWLNDAADFFHAHGNEFSYPKVLAEMEVDHFEVAAWHYEAKGQHCYFSGNDNNAVLVQFQTKPLNVKVDTTEADIHGLKCEVLSLGSRCSMIEGDLVPLKANAGARVGVDSPFGG